MIKVKDSIIQDAINIHNGVYAPISGFLREQDFNSVVNAMRLDSGKIWSIPIVLDISDNQLLELKGKNELKLVSPDESVWVVLKNLTYYKYNKYQFIKQTFGTTNISHPGVAQAINMDRYLVGGEIAEVNGTYNSFNKHNLTPLDTRKMFKEKGWDTVVAFQTRNVPHIGHEFLQKHALKSIDGLLIHPVIGEKKDKDFKDEYILSSYELLIDKYFEKNKAMLAALPLNMRYAGPREAVMHAMIRKNFGCTHFIVGRDHAGVGDFYHPEEAQKVFDNFSEDELGIKILKYDEVVFDQKKQQHCFIDESAENDRIKFSGTKLRNIILNKEEPPAYLIRPEVHNFLLNSMEPFVEKNQSKLDNTNQKGFVLWFTGLSAAGKSTIADEVFKILKNKSIKIERLDGDVVRENLTKGLGFSKEDRDENIKRIGFVADLLSHNGVGVVASFITPYKEQREKLKANVHNFIEVFVNTSIEICEKRDPKGLYKKARKGEIKMFTGISDPYEEPENADIVLKTQDNSVEDCASAVIAYLEKNNYIIK